MAAPADTVTLTLQQLPRELLPLANRFYRRHHRGMKVNGQQQIWVLRAPDICASLCLQPVETGHWLTALLVAPAMRAQGLGTQLLDQVRAEVDGPIWLFCAPHLTPFYQRCGYQLAAHLPESLDSRLQRYQRSKSLVALANLPG